MLHCSGFQREGDSSSPVIILSLASLGQDESGQLNTGNHQTLYLLDASTIAIMHGTR
jgi:hypothetical protein